MTELMYPLLFILILGMNTIPAFMPPTWIVLSFFYINYHLTLIPTVILGAIAAATGRYILANISERYFRHFFPNNTLENYDALGNYLQKNQKFTIPIIILYAFLPIPSNQVFIIAGLTEINLKLITFSFLAGRLISYTFWISIAAHTIKQFESIFIRHISKTDTFIIEFIGFGLIYLIGKINWKKILHYQQKSD